MIATLKFDLPDEEVDFRAALQGPEAKAVLWEIDQRCRSLLKHGNPGEDLAAFAEEVRLIIRESKENLLGD